MRIENVRGQIAVEGWDRDEVSVKGTLDDETKKFTFETSGSTTTVKVETPNGLNRGKGSDLVIHVPAASRVRVDLVSAELSLKNLHGGIDGKTVSGNIDADGSGRTAGNRNGQRLDQGGRRRRCRDVPFGERRHQGRHQCRGDRRFDVSGEADVTTGKRLKEATFNSVSGDVQMSADLADGARIKGSSTSGDVRLQVNRRRRRRRRTACDQRQHQKRPDERPRLARYLGRPGPRIHDGRRRGFDRVDDGVRQTRTDAALTGKRRRG